jgi:lipid-A-disaccharide synthase-like uncharacterized protein
MFILRFYNCYHFVNFPHFSIFLILLTIIYLFFNQQPVFIIVYLRNYFQKFDENL